MRISDWSSDVCSSDLANSSSTLPQASTASASTCSPSRRMAIVSLPSASIISTARTEASSRYSESWAFLWRSEEHTSELQSLMRISYAVFCLKKKKQIKYQTDNKISNT